MSLELVTQEQRNQKSVSGGIVLNTEFMGEVQTTETTKSKFHFYNKPEDRRGGFDKFVVTESRAAILTGMNTALNAIGLTLNVYPDNDATKSVVATVFNADEIIMAYPNSRTDKTKCWIEVNEKGTRVRKYLVNHYYVDIAALAETGTTTTTSTTTS